VAIVSDLIAHRGSDARATWRYEDDWVFIDLNYRRRSLIDLSYPFAARAGFSIKGNDKIRRRQGEAAFEQTAESWLPHETVHKPKASVSTIPPGVGARRLVGHVIAGLARGYPAEPELIRSDVLRRLIQDERFGGEDRAKQIWRLPTTELWYRSMRSMDVAA
jgi:hypothetical protein